jgi:hypothetical protein
MWRAGWRVEPAFVFVDRDSVVAGYGLERLKIAAANRAKDGVIGESGAACDLARGEDVSRGSGHALVVLYRFRNRL